MPRIKQIRPETQFFPKKLTEKLNFIKRYPLTLIEAPSGFGKTTSLRHFFETEIPKSTPVYWHTFSPDRPATSWKAFCEMVEKFDSEKAMLLFDAGPPDEDTLPEIRDIFRKLDCVQETYMVLDDFASWSLPSPGEFLASLSFHGGKGLHIAVASQLLPQGEHDAILQSNRFCLLQESVLTFTRDDIAVYYHKAGITLTDAQLNEAEEITEGWIMALYLQMLSFAESGKFDRGGTNSLMQKALWNRLPPKEKELLLNLSVFPRFSLTQATALSGISPAETEKLLKEKRVFVHFDKEDGRFYLHSLFQSFLTKQFELLPENRKKETYLTCGALAEQAGDRVNTLSFYYRAGAWEKILSMHLTSYEIADIADNDTKPMILDIIENTPFETKKKHPAAMVPLAFALFFLHENKKFLAIQQEIQHIICESSLSEDEKNALLGEMELLLCFLEYNRIGDMSAHHRKALKLLKGPASLINVKSTWTFGSPSVLYMYYRESGKLDHELEQMDECMPIYYALTEGHGSGAEIIMRAEAHFMRGEPEDAEILCHRAILTADARNQNSICQCGLFLLGRIALMKGDKAMLGSAVEQARERSRQHTQDLCRYTLDLILGYLNLLTGNMEEIPRWLSEGDINDKRLVIMTQPFAYMIYGRILLERKEYLKLIGTCQHLLGISSIFPNLLPQIYAKIYIAQALYASGKPAEAVSVLGEALSAALPDGIYMPFVENHEGLKKLLPAVGGNTGTEQIERLSEIFKSSLGIMQAAKPSFTPRETEIIELVRQGLSNKEIAAELYISVSTVKTLLGRIYEKTGVSTKTQLVMLDL